MAKSLYTKQLDFLILSPVWKVGKLPLLQSEEQDGTETQEN